MGVFSHSRLSTSSCDWMTRSTLSRGACDSGGRGTDLRAAAVVDVADVPHLRADLGQLRAQLAQLREVVLQLLVDVRDRGRERAGRAPLRLLFAA